MRRLFKAFCDIALVSLLSANNLVMQSVNADEAIKERFNLEQKIQTVFPVDGLILTTSYDTDLSKPGLQAPVVGTVPSGSNVWINNIPVEILDLHSEEKIRLSPYLEILEKDDGAEVIAGGLVIPVDIKKYDLFTYWIDTSSSVIELEIMAKKDEDIFLKNETFYYDNNSEKTYSITIDDSGDILADIAAKNYNSVFDNHVLGRLRELHQKYDAVFSFFLFNNGTLYQNFSLSQLYDKYKSEWKENSNWLRFGFHAEQMNPVRPYHDASYQKAREDLLEVKSQVLRFAGETSLDVFMRSHWWSGSLESCRAWRDNGIKGLYAAKHGIQAYYLNPFQNRIMEFCDYWRDNKEDILFVQTDLWIEKDIITKPNLEDAIDETMRKILQNPLSINNIQVFTHEAYLVAPHNHHKVQEKLEAIIAWLTSNKYKAQFDSDNNFFNLFPPSIPFNLRVEKIAEDKTLVWDHKSNENGSYLVFEKDLSNVFSEWKQIGETYEKAWKIRSDDRIFAYRITYSKERGMKSNSQSIIIRPEPISEEFIAKVYPNPFNDRVTIQYSVPMDGIVRIRIFNILGQEIWESSPQQRNRGKYWHDWDGKDKYGRNLSSGLYFAKIQAGRYEVTQKMILMK